MKTISISIVLMLNIIRIMTIRYLHKNQPSVINMYLINAKLHNIHIIIIMYVEWVCIEFHKKNQQYVNFATLRV